MIQGYLRIDRQYSIKFDYEGVEVRNVKTHVQVLSSRIYSSYLWNSRKHPPNHLHERYMRHINPLMIDK